jgi:hypothetical protein
VPNRLIPWLFSLILAFAVLATGCVTSKTTNNADNAGNANNHGCAEGLTWCADECVATFADERHCGGCDLPCPQYGVCLPPGTCVLECPDGMDECPDLCTILVNDPANCGECGRACNTGVACVGGQCQDEPCLETVAEAAPVVLPADIVVVVDNSASMWDEAESVQASMVDFVGALTASGIDAHVAIISDDSEGDVGVCVPAPVGSGLCPYDENLPTYRHVVYKVGSTNALELVLVLHGEYDDWQRPEATKTVVVISDDNSNLGAQAFHTQLVQLDPTFAGFKFSAIHAPYNMSYWDCLQCELNGTCNTPACDECCGTDTLLNLVCTPLPASDGTVYRELVTMTGGVSGNLCTQDFLPVFQDLATAVISGARVPCAYDVPTPPEGELIDYERINMDYQENPDVLPEALYHVPGGQGACGPEGGWYYDDHDPPSQLLLCPTTCSRVTASPEAIVKVKYGCSTIVR